MSLVNDMLRDLEQRDKKDSVSDSNAPLKAAPVASDEQSPSNNSGLKIVLVLIALAAIGVTLWLLFAGPLLNTGQAPQDGQPAQISTPNLEVQPPAVIQAGSAEQTVQIHSIRWSGTETGGDLVVRLDGEADIQLLGQDQTSVNIAFEDVELAAGLPKVSGPLIDRIDVFRDKSRTELMLTTKVDSQFAFRVQHSPTTMILGVLPQENTVSEATPAIVKPALQEPAPKAFKAVSKIPAAAPVKMAEVKSKPAQPIKKTQRIVSDKESVAQARKLIQKGRLADAMQVLQKRINQSPQQSIAARGYLATLQLSAGMKQEANQLLQESLQIHADDYTLRKLKSRLLLSEGKTTQSLNLLQQSLPEISEDSEYFELLATAYQQQGNYEQSAKVYYSLLEYQNNTPRWWVGMAYSLELDKRYDEALRAYRSAVQIPGIKASLKSYAEQRVQALSGR